jgi:hypothetical protein
LPKYIEAGLGREPVGRDHHHMWRRKAHGRRNYKRDRRPPNLHVASTFPSNLLSDAPYKDIDPEP